MATARIPVLVVRARALKSEGGRTLYHQLRHTRLGEFFDPDKVPAYPGNEQWFDAARRDRGVGWVFYGFSHSPEELKASRPLWRVWATWFGAPDGYWWSWHLCDERMRPGDDAERVAHDYNGMWRNRMRECGHSERIVDSATYTARLIDPGTPLPPLPPFTPLEWQRKIIARG